MRFQPAVAALSTLVDGLFPHYCALCDLPSERSLPLCWECEGSLQRNVHHCCICALPLPATAGRGGRRCPDCLALRHDVDRVRAPFVYSRELSFLIARWKYQRDLSLTGLLASLWLRNTVLETPPDIILPMPLHWRRLMHRGFNQAQLLAHAIIAGHPSLQSAQLQPRLLRRVQATPAQAGLDARQRRDNTSRAFTLRGACDNLNIAIVDDVITTGATANAAARSLHAAGARHVEVWCIARTPTPDGSQT